VASTRPVVRREEPLRWMACGLVLGALVLAFVTPWLPDRALAAGSLAVPVGFLGAAYLDRRR
jgi:hypothetical protein